MGDDGAKNVNSEELYQRARFYNKHVADYLTKHYQISKRGTSKITEYEDIPSTVKENLEDSVKSYVSKDYFGKYYDYAIKNGFEKLKTKLTDEFKSKCSNLAPSEFLSTCAPYILVSYELSELVAEFHEALEFAIDAMTEVTVASDELWFSNMWRP